MGNNLYQYKFVLCGFKNSLIAFIRVLGTVLGDGLEENGATYVVDVFGHKLCFEDHL